MIVLWQCCDGTAITELGSLVHDLIRWNIALESCRCVFKFSAFFKFKTKISEREKEERERKA
jgi:hypothetical protein